MICQACGVEAPTKYVAFYQNIGALIIRFTNSVEGNLCKACIRKYFWQMTPITFVAGWWGMISFVVTPFILLNNTIRYLSCLGMEDVPADATAPEVTEEVGRKLAPYLDGIFERLQADEPLEQVAQDVAPAAGVTPGQVILYVIMIVRATRQQGGDQRNE